MDDYQGISATDLRSLAAAMGNDMRSVRKLAAVIGQDVHDLRERLFAVDETVGDDDQTVIIVSSSSFYFDPFRVGATPPALPLPQAADRVRSVIGQAPEQEHVVVWVAESGWDGFYSRVLAAAEIWPVFLETAVAIGALGAAGNESGYQPGFLWFPANSGLTALNAWEGNYAAVYTAVLVLRYPAGATPMEYQV